MSGYLTGPAFPVVCPTNVAGLRAVASAPLKQDCTAVITAAFWYWDPTSVAADDGTTVLCPNDIVHPAPGRWLVSPFGHTQNTDTGTTQETFILDSGGAGSGPMRIAADANGIAARNGADSAYEAFIGTHLVSSASGDYINAEGSTVSFFVLGMGGANDVAVKADASHRVAARNALDSAYAAFIGTYLFSSATGDAINAEGTTASTFSIDIGGTQVDLTASANALGTSAYTVTLDAANAGAEHTVAFMFNRGSTGLDTGLRWPSGGTAVQVSHDGSAWSDVASRWTQIASFTATPTSASIISGLTTAISNRQIRVGSPVKWLCAGGVGGIISIGDTGGILTSEAFTGLSSRNIDRDGLLYVECEEVADPDYVLRFYKGSTSDAANLIGHTATFDDTASAPQAIIEDNGSGFGGTVTNGAGACADGAHFGVIVAWAGIVTSYSTTNMTIAGPPLVTGSASISELWIGTPEMVRRERWKVDASPLSAVTDTILDDNEFPAYTTEQGFIRVLKLRVWAQSHGGGAAYINLMNGTQEFCSDGGDNGLNITAAHTWFETGVNINRATSVATPNNDLEFACKVLDAGAGASATFEFLYLAL